MSAKNIINVRFEPAPEPQPVPIADATAEAEFREQIWRLYFQEADEAGCSHEECCQYANQMTERTPVPA